MLLAKSISRFPARFSLFRSPFFGINLTRNNNLKMNGIVKAALRLPSLRTIVVSPLFLRAKTVVSKDLSRGIRHLCAPRQNGAILMHNHSNACSCGCGLKEIHTKEEFITIKGTGRNLQNSIGERELVEFLTEEIVAETKARKVAKLSTELEGFQVKSEGAELTFTKENKDEKITIVLNVNHTVDSDESDELDPNTNKSEEFAEMRSKPQFEIDLIRGKKTISFTCSFVQDQQPQEGEGCTNDVFGIDEVTYYEGEWNDKVYAVAGDVLDGYLYDLLMNVLEEKGISNEFVEKLSDYCTAFEHSEYISLLQNMSQFTIGK